MMLQVMLQSILITSVLVLFLQVFFPPAQRLQLIASKKKKRHALLHSYFKLSLSLFSSQTEVGQAHVQQAHSHTGCACEHISQFLPRSKSCSFRLCRWCELVAWAHGSGPQGMLFDKSTFVVAQVYL